MRNYLLAVLGWIFFLLGLLGTGFVVFRLLYPFVLGLILENLGTTNNEIAFVAKIGVLFATVFITVVCFYVFFSRSEMGLVLKNWFIDINQKTFWAPK